MTSGGWAYGLLHAIKDPKEWIISTDQLVVIKDKFPKAMFHFLVIPKQNITNIFQLTKDHLDLLQEMRMLAVNVIEVNGRELDEFRIGFHAEPSMQQLHLHVISKDFNSPFLKTKKHWNSFTTDFFIPHQDLVDQLTKTGTISKLSAAEAKDLLTTPLKCNKCSQASKNMPDLKNHLRTHDREYNI